MEKSKSSEPPRCPCGFWGSPSTLGLCSTCYKAHVEKSNEAFKSTPDHMIPKTDTGIQMKTGSNGLNSAPQPSSSRDGSSNNIQNCASSSSTTDHTTGSVNILVTSSSQQQSINSGSDSTKDTNLNKDLPEKTTSSSSPSPSPSPSSSSNNMNDKDNIDCVKLCSVTNEPSPGATTAEQLQIDDKRGTKRNHDTMEEQISTPESSPEKPAQKNKKRCNECKCKLELAQRQIGLCRCGYVFCALHRLPELHNCDFDHKEDGRREAREKMVKPKRHLGTSFKRIDSDS